MQSRYQNIPTTKYNITGSEYYQTNVYPTVQPTDTDYYVITTVNDRLDLLAFDFYQDSSLWWIGIQLRIPTNIQSILNTYNLVNDGY